MARKNSKSEPAVERLSDEEIAEAEARNDLTASGRDRTEVSTETKVEDRTEEPASRRDVEYEVEETELSGGTVLTSYGEAKASK